MTPPLRRLLGRAAADPETAGSPLPDPGAPCEELAQAPADAAPRTPDGCEECLAIGSGWVHLRLCLACGHVGCCDSGQHHHATKHAEAEGHPVMRSFEPGESWRWCYVHELLG